MCCSGPKPLSAGRQPAHRKNKQHDLKKKNQTKQPKASVGKSDDDDDVMI